MKDYDVHHTSIKFLGGAEEVGKVGMLLETRNHRVIFDYGFNAEDPPNYPIFANEPIDFAFLTHAHLDHSGMMPYLTKGDTEFFGTPLTSEIATLLHEDSLKIAKLEGYSHPYGKKSVRLFRSRYHNVKVNQTITLQDISIDVKYAGHIPGAVMYLVTGNKTLLFTGDINYIDTDLVYKCDTPRADILVVEATYAGRNHPDRKETERLFVEEVRNTIETGGKVVIPSFAVGRTQEVLISLNMLNGKYNIWLDGMGKKINQIYTQFRQYIKNFSGLKKAMLNINVVNNRYDRERAMMEGDIIVTTSGMLDGGPVEYYLSNIKDDPKSAVYLTGFQVPHSNGRRLFEQGIVDLYGLMVQPQFKVKMFNFSAHIDHNNLVRFIREVNPEKVILMHTDNREPIMQELKGEYNFIVPKNGEKILLDL
jgi:putative mRNA 3-end processing factor